MKRIKIIFSITFVIIFSFSFFIFSGCSNDGDETKETNVTIELTLKNYSNYFTLQEEAISYNENYYTTQNGFNMKRANQTTKISILKLVSNIKEFNNVRITIKNDTYMGQYWHQDKGYFAKYRWEGPGGNLNLSYDGQGVVVLSAVYDGYPSEFQSVKYAISSISGSITLN